MYITLLTPETAQNKMPDSSQYLANSIRKKTVIKSHYKIHGT